MLISNVLKYLATSEVATSAASCKTPRIYCSLHVQQRGWCLKERLSDKGWAVTVYFDVFILVLRGFFLLAT